MSGWKLQDLEDRMTLSFGIVGLIVLVVSIFVALHIRHTTPPCQHQSKKADWTPTNQRLGVAYKEFDEEYFLNFLPAKKTDVRLGDLTDQEELGHIEQRGDGTWLIIIDTKGHPTERQAEMTLIHEMCHQKVKIMKDDAGLDGHSGAFESCMEMVADHGGFKDLW